MDAAVTLAKHVTGVQYKDIPPEAIAAAKRDILDTLGAAVVGTTADGVKELLGLVKYWGGKRSSTILVYGNRVPSHNAALINGTMARALEVDSCYHYPPVHGCVSVLPAAMAVAEQKGGVNGKDFLTAIILGLDVEVYMALGAKKFWGMSQAALYAYFGAAAATGRLLGLDEERMLNALGIAHAQAAAEHQSILDGALTKRLSSGQAAQGGVFAAMLARTGFTGAHNCLEGNFGLYNTFERGEYDPQKITAQLGKRFAVVDTNYKPYPCCGATHGSIDATLALVREHDIRPDRVADVRVEVSSMHYKIVCQPLEPKRKPQTISGAQFSVPFVVAAAIIDRKVVLDQFTNETINRRDILDLAARVNPEIDPNLTPLTPSAFQARVTIRTKDGKSYSKVQDVPRGGPKYPISTKELTDKFRDFAAHAIRPLPRANVEKVIKLVDRLEEVPDVTSITKLLVAEPARVKAKTR